MDFLPYITQHDEHFPSHTAVAVRRKAASLMQRRGIPAVCLFVVQLVTAQAHEIN